MRVIIAGVGDIGRKLAEMLNRRENMELVLVDEDEKNCEDLAAGMDALVLQGDATDPEILKKAQATDADALIAATGIDAINTVIAMLGHRLGVKKIIVKLNDVGLRAACQEIGVAKIIMPKISAASEILSSLYGFDRLDFSPVVHGGLRLVELEAGTAAGKKIADLGFPEGTLIVSILRGDEVLIPRGATKVLEGDIFIALVQNEDVLSQLERLLSPSS